MTKITYRGACSCGWKGGWRTTDVDALADRKKHNKETGHKAFEGDDLMPHERREND